PNNAPILSKGKLVDVTWRGRTDKRGITIYHVGGVAAKHYLYSRLSADAERQADARLVHFSDQLPPEFFPGLVSEVYNPVKNRFEKRVVRNEPLDTWVYAYAAAHHSEVRLHRYSKVDWDCLDEHVLKEVSLPVSDDSRETSSASLTKQEPLAPSRSVGKEQRSLGFANEGWVL
ncbi:terminase gpA endonuclease subunit, partial [Xanthomonas vasicola]